MKSLIFGVFFMLPLISTNPINIKSSKVAEPEKTKKEACNCGMSIQEVNQLFAETLTLDGNCQLGFHGLNRNYAQSATTAMNNVGLNGLTVTFSSEFEQMQRGVASVRNTANMRLIQTSYDIERARNENKLGVMFYSQKHYPLNNNVNRLSTFYSSGLRVFQITYGGSDQPNQRNTERLGAGVFDDHPTYRRDNDIRYNDFGLTNLGRAAVRKCNQLNMLIDVSHCHQETIADVLALSTKPIIANHANARARNASRRNLTDDMIRGIAQKGGVIGVMPVGGFMDTDGDGNDVDDMVTHINHIVDVAGIDHVGLSTDGWMDGWPNDSGFYPGPQMSHYNRWKTLIRALSKETKNGRCRYNTSDLKKIMGWNFLRVYQEVLKGHTKPEILSNRKYKAQWFRFAWKPSRTNNVPTPQYDLIIYGYNGFEYNVIRRYNNLSANSKIVPIKELYGPRNRPYSKYKYFIRSHNKIGATNSRWGFFSL